MKDFRNPSTAPLDVQREIVAEIEGYQRVIDGARATIAQAEQDIEGVVARVWGEG